MLSCRVQNPLTCSLCCMPCQLAALPFTYLPVDLVGSSKLSSQLFKVCPLLSNSILQSLESYFAMQFLIEDFRAHRLLLSFLKICALYTALLPHGKLGI